MKQVCFDKKGGKENGRPENKEQESIPTFQYLLFHLYDFHLFDARASCNIRFFFRREMGDVPDWTDLAYRRLQFEWIQNGDAEPFADDQLSEHDCLCFYFNRYRYACNCHGGVCTVPEKLFVALYDSRWAVILPTCINAFNLIIVRTAIANVPPALEESAMLDGAGRMRILFQIILPLIKATVATIILYYAVGHWNSWFHASIFLRTRDKYPLQLVMKEILISGDISSTAASTMSSSDFSGDTVLYKQLIKYCTIVMSSAPVFIFYPFIQKYFEAGVMIGSIKE